MLAIAPVMQLKDWALIYQYKLQNGEENEQPLGPLYINFSFNSVVRKMEREKVYLQYQFAYLSTLGGAYHLCSQPRVALAIARRQETVGRQLESLSIIVRAKVFQAINLKMLGDEKQSYEILSESYAITDRNNMSDMRTFVASCHGWLERNYGTITHHNNTTGYNHTANTPSIEVLNINGADNLMDLMIQ